MHRSYCCICCSCLDLAVDLATPPSLSMDAYGLRVTGARATAQVQRRVVVEQRIREVIDCIAKRSKKVQKILAIRWGWGRSSSVSEESSSSEEAADGDDTFASSAGHAGSGASRTCRKGKRGKGIASSSRKGKAKAKARGRPVSHGCAASEAEMSDQRIVKTWLSVLWHYKGHPLAELHR